MENEIKNSAYRMGFDLVAISRADPLEREREMYRRWCEEGMAAGLAYMVRERPRRWAPQDLLPEARSVVTFAVNFFSGERRVGPRRGCGRVARYAWGRDYHEVIKQKLEEWARALPAILGRPVRTKVLVDSAPLLERGFAARSGIGFVGKNTLIISRKLGSFLFLGEVLTDLELAADEVPEARSGDACGACRECIRECPTQALVSPRVLDARKCISYWTIENKAGIPADLRPGIGDWIFGCDICQDVCPYNGLGRETAWKEFKAGSGTGPYLPVLEVLGIGSDEDFRARFAGTPILRAKRSGLLRNACVVAGNQSLEEAVPLLKRLEEGGDPVLSEHAAWALARIRGS